jgi:hypothetical protein
MAGHVVEDIQVVMILSVSREENDAGWKMIDSS